MSVSARRFVLRLLAMGFLAALPGLAAADPTRDAATEAALIDRIETAYHARDLATLEDVRRDLLGPEAGAGTHARVGYHAAYVRFRQALAQSDDRPVAKTYLDDCISELERYLEARPTDAEARALVGSCYGLSTAYNPLAFMARGLESRRHLDAALELAPANPWVVMQDGLAVFATPRVFGGSRSGAIARLERAARLFGDEAEAGSRPAAWAEIEAWQQLSLMYAATGQADAAAEAEARAARLPRNAVRIQQASLR